MAGWLKSMGSILDKLDDGVETVVDETDQARSVLAERLVAFGTTAAQRAAAEVRGRMGNKSDGEYESYDEEEDEEEGSYEDEEGNEEDSYEEVGHSDAYPESGYEGEEENDQEETLELTDDTENSCGLKIAQRKLFHDSTEEEVGEPSKSTKLTPPVETPVREAETKGAAVSKKDPAVPSKNVPDSQAKSSSTVSQTAESVISVPPPKAAPAIQSPGSSSDPVQTKRLQERPIPPPPPPPPAQPSTLPVTGTTTKPPPPTSAGKSSSIPGSSSASTKSRSGRQPSPPLESGNSTARSAVAAGMSSSSTSKSSSKQQQQQQQQMIATLQQNQRRLEKQNQQQQAQLEAVQAELVAQQKELDRAAEQLMTLRQQHKEEQDDLLEEQEEELQNLREDYEAKMKDQREHYELQLASMKAKLEDEISKRAQEGGDLTQELEAVISRERNALMQCHDLRAENKSLQVKIQDLLDDQSAVKQRVESLEQTTKAAAARERDAEERLDAALQHHKHQLVQRQAREQELEQTISELGAALAASQAPKPENDAATLEALLSAPEFVAMKEKYGAALEEIETLQTQLTLSNQQCDALTAELNDVSSERTREATISQERQRENEQRMNDLATQVKQLESALRERSDDRREETGGAQQNDSETRLRQALRIAQESNASLSDELLRQQGLAETAKAEILALKGRLQSANARADAAEQQALASDNRLVEMEGGSTSWSASKNRRRVKGGLTGVGASGRPHHLSSRSARAALGLRVVHGSTMEQVALTLDAFDGWMTDLCDTMKHEPLVRMGFAFYLSILHLWCVGLVFFHAVESEHGDLGTLTHPGGPLHQKR